MLYTYSRIISDAQDSVSNTSSSVKTFLKRRINNRFELITDKLNSWSQVLIRTTSSVADQQYYYNPPNLREITSIVVTIDSFDYPLQPVYSQEEWDMLNAQTVTSVYPRRYFRRPTDYGIWPTPGTAGWTITINYTQRPQPLYFEDYTTGTVTVTENDQTVTFAGGADISSNDGDVKAGFWFSLTDSNGEPRGTAYKIGSVTDSTNLELETFYEETTESGATYLIGQVPDIIPAEGHELLSIGATSDFYAQKTKDINAATAFENKFWSGSYNVTPLQARKDEKAGGLAGLIQAYEDRDNSKVVERNIDFPDLLNFQIPRTITVN